MLFIYGEHKLMEFMNEARLKLVKQLLCSKLVQWR